MGHSDITSGRLLALQENHSQQEFDSLLLRLTLSEEESMPGVQVGVLQNPDNKISHFKPSPPTNI